MKLNTDKCLCESQSLNIIAFGLRLKKIKFGKIKKSSFLGVTCDTDFKVENHISKMWSKADEKLREIRINFKSFFESQFKHWPLIWIFSSTKAGNKINKLHERATRIVYDDSESSFVELLQRNVTLFTYITKTLRH